MPPSRSLFLAWALFNTLYAAGLAAGAILYDGNVKPVGYLAAGAILATYTVVSGHCGVLAWRWDVDRLEHLALAIEISPMVAMLGTLAGFLVAFEGKGDVQQRVFGATTGLAATFVGVASTVMLILLSHLLVHWPRPSGQAEPVVDERPLGLA